MSLILENCINENSLSFNKRQEFSLTFFILETLRKRSHIKYVLPHGVQKLQLRRSKVEKKIKL